MVGTAVGADEAIAALLQHEPDVVLLDMAIPDNVWLVRALVAAVPGTKRWSRSRYPRSSAR